MDRDILFGGTPTKPDIDNLRKAFGVPEEGQIIKHEAIEAVINEKRVSNRYKTVVNRWRRIMESEHNCVFGAEEGVGYRVLNPDDRMEVAVRNRESGTRKFRRCAKLTVTTDRKRLSPENAKVAAHLEHQLAAVKLALATKPKPLDLPDLSKK